MKSFLAAVAAMGLMAIFGLVIYSILGTLQTTTNHSHNPTKTSALISLPGKVVVAQNGSLYQLQGLTFTKLSTPPGYWMQASVAPNGDLVAVDRTSSYSDVYLLNSQGHQVSLLLQESASQLLNNHWVFYPRVASNGTLFYAWDWHDPYASYNVDFQIQAVPLNNPGASATIWSTPNNYQGGDVEPAPLSNGGVIYAKYYVGGSLAPSPGATYSILSYASSPYANPVNLTTASENCSQPSISPTGTEVAMICTNVTLQTSTIDIATWNGTSLGTPQVVAPGPLDASPSWSPDGKSLLFLNPSPTKASQFQLFWIPNVLAAHPSAPRQVTQGLNLDALSAPVWTS